ncbi:MAG: LacI family DNA-binding transcriptional regulator [Stappiaceae bacterium]
MKQKRIATMEEFAEAVDLSRQTVSRYFNDPSSVRKGTRDIIEAGLEQFDYQRNFHAASLTRRKARSIGIIVPSITDPFYSELVSTIELYAEDRGYLTVLQCSHNDASMEGRALTRLLANNVQGIAMAPLGFTTDLQMVESAQRDTPIVFMDSRLHADAAYIGTDNQQSIGQLVDYLCETGQPPALFTMPAVNINVVERQQAYISRMEALGHTPTILNPDPESVWDDYERFGFEQFMNLPPERIRNVSTILCLNDRIAFGLMTAAHRLGLRVGTGDDADIRLAGHDDQHFSRYTNPTLTTVAQDPKAIGILAAQALLENEGDNELMHRGRLIQGKLRLRQSA